MIAWSLYKELKTHSEKRVPNKSQGVFITLEGGDGSGKTTLQQKLSSHLSSLGYVIVVTRAPGGTPLGASIRDILLHKTKIALCARAELLLFLADRAQHVEEVIVPALHKKQIVLCDRFNDSTIAYQGGAREEDLEKIGSLCRFASVDVEPHLTFYLDVDPKLGLERALRIKSASDRLEGEALAFHQKVRAAYLALAKKYPQRIHVLDGSVSPERVFAKAVDILSSYLAKVK